MITICAGLFLRITKTTNDDLPLGSVLVISLLFDLFMALASIAMLVDGPLVPLVHLLVQGFCR